MYAIFRILTLRTSATLAPYLALLSALRNRQPAHPFPASYNVIFFFFSESKTAKKTD